MPFNGNGSFSAYTPGNPAVTGSVVSSTAFNNTVNDIATGLSNTLTRDGQSPATANIPMGGNKLTGLANGTAATDAAAFGQFNASTGSANVGFIQSGTGAVARAVQDKARESVSVKDFGAVGDGVTDDRAAIVAAITYVSAAGGRVYFPPGTYIVSSSFTVPSNVTLVGAGMRATTIKRGFTGDFITSFGGYCGLEDLTIDGNTATWGTGKGVIFAATSPNSHFRNIEIQNFVQSCVVFPSDQSGATFRANSCNFYTTGTPGTVAAVSCTGIDTAAASRHFYNCESAGCTLFDFSGMNDTYVSGGYTRDFITSANTSKLLMNLVRVGNVGAITINGSSHSFDDIVFADVVTLACINSHFNCIVPSYAITDNGTGNDVFQRQVSYTSAWTASGTAPAIGNGSITATYNRTGSMIEVLWDVSFGTTTTVGTGQWFFSLPRADYSSLVQMGGSGYAANSGPTSAATFVLRVEPGAQKVSMFYVDTAGVPQNIGQLKPAATWGAGSTLRFSTRYYTT